MNFWKSTYNELIKIAAKPRSYIGIGAITLIVAIILFAMKIDGLEFISFLTKPFEQSISFEGNILNGNLVAFVVLQMLIVHVPLLIALVTGDLISGEAAMGTIRLLLTKPISRTSILFSKYLAGSAYTLVMLIWLMFMALVVGKMLFGTGDLMVLGGNGLIVFHEQDVAWRFVYGFSLAFLSLLMIASLSLTLSCFSDNSIGPIVSTMAIIILFTIISNLDMPVLQKLQPYLFTNHMVAWRNFFEDPISTKEILKSCGILFAHIIGLLSVAVYKFNKKDILS
jgi:ABC-2 type transport system permease protein